MKMKNHGIIYMKMCLFCLLLVFLFHHVFAENAVKILPMPDLTKPGQIAIDDSQIYITDDAEVCIYSLKELTLKKKFGKRGEGPQEFVFQIDIAINVQTSNILVLSTGKLSFFTKDGEFVKVLKYLPKYGKFTPVNGKFIGGGSRNTPEYTGVTLNFFDRELNFQKEIYYLGIPRYKDKRLFLYTPWDFHTYNGKVFLAAEADFKINVFDDTGKELTVITHDYERVKVTDELRNRFLNWVKKYRPPNYYDFFKRYIKFPDYFPAVLQMRVDDGKIYVLTYKEKGDGTCEFVVFDTNGKFVKQVYVPFEKSDPVHVMPFTVSQGKLYQLVDNEETEEYELHIVSIL